MNLVQGILLGLLQGVAEFLPISSSGHLALAKALFGLDDLPILFDVLLHIATLLAVVIFFRKRIWSLLCTFARLFVRKDAHFDGLSPEESQLEENKNRRYIVSVIIATFITGILGIVNSKLIGDLSVKFVCAGFLVTACLLILSAIVEKRMQKSQEKNASANNLPPSWKQAIVIGFAQGCGTLPGISRSGSTIAGALFCGTNRIVAGEFSFIIAIPAILGAFLLELKDVSQMAGVGLLPILLGCLTAFVSGYIALYLLMKIIRKGHLEWFACYLIPVGVLGLIFL